MSAAPRLASLDAFRGFAIAGMVLVNNPGTWSAVHPPLAHAEWNGCTFTDLIFPFFLFAAGLSLTLSLGGRAREGQDRPAILRTLVQRAGIIFLIGLALNAIPTFNLATLRIPGVLQRIALTLVLGAPVVLWGRWRAALAAIVGLFGVYLALMLLVPVPGTDGIVAAGRLLPGLDFSSWVDRLVLGGHLWAKARTWDPEGLVGTLTATASLLSGVLAGHHLAAPAGRVPKWVWLVRAGLICLGVGSLLGTHVMPINKNLWTPTYVIFTSGWSLVTLGVFHWALDESPAAFRTLARKACLPLTIYGMNALFLFVLSGVIGRLLQTIRVGGTTPIPLKAALYGVLAALPLAPADASLLFAVLFDLVLFAVAWVMWRNRWFVKV